jgi:hypothetical protein
MKISLGRKLVPVSLVPALLAGTWLLGGCAVRPADDMSYAPVPQAVYARVNYPSPDSYIWDGYEYVGVYDDTYYYLGPNDQWMRCEPWREHRFRDWEHSNPDWRNHARRNDRKSRDGKRHPGTPQNYAPSPLRTAPQPHVAPPQQPPAPPTAQHPRTTPPSQPARPSLATPQKPRPQVRQPGNVLRHDGNADGSSTRLGDRNSAPQGHAAPNPANNPRDTGKPKAPNKDSHVKTEPHSGKEPSHVRDDDEDKKKK